MKNIFLIVNYNDFDNTYKLYKNIEKYGCLDEIIIIDNASKKDCQNKIKQIKNKKLAVLFSEKNNGYGSAINIGCKYIKNKYKDANIIISNSDIIIDKEKDIIKLIENINNTENACAIAPLVKQNNEIVCGWRFPSIKDALILNIPKINRKYERNKLNYNFENFDKGLNEVDVISGCFFIIRLSALEKINYFDENLFLYYEENTIFYRLKKFNYKVYVDRDVTIIHNHSITINKNINSKDKLKILKKSQEYYYSKVLKTNKFMLFLLKLSNKIVLLLK